LKVIFEFCPDVLASVDAGDVPPVISGRTDDGREVCLMVASVGISPCSAFQAFSRAFARFRQRTPPRPIAAAFVRPSNN
jgi:hypothetical protein